MPENEQKKPAAFESLRERLWTLWKKNSAEIVFTSLFSAAVVGAVVESQLSSTNPPPKAPPIIKNYLTDIADDLHTYKAYLHVEHGYHVTTYKEKYLNNNLNKEELEELIQDYIKFHDSLSQKYQHFIDIKDALTEGSEEWVEFIERHAFSLEQLRIEAEIVESTYGALKEFTTGEKPSKGKRLLWETMCDNFDNGILHLFLNEAKDNDAISKVEFSTPELKSLMELGAQELEKELEKLSIDSQQFIKKFKDRTEIGKIIVTTTEAVTKEYVVLNRLPPETVDALIEAIKTWKEQGLYTLSSNVPDANDNSVKNLKELSTIAAPQNTPGK